MLIVTGDCDWDVAWPEAVAVIQRIKRVRAAQLALVCATHKGHICEAVYVCVYLLNTSEILYPYLVFACVEACFAIASAFPAPLTYFSGIFTCCRRVVQRKLMPLVYMCVCVCICNCASVYHSILYLCARAFSLPLCKLYKDDDDVDIREDRQRLSPYAALSA